MIIGRYLGLVKFEHTLFAMPFALISLLVAAEGRPELSKLLWVIVAMVGARSAAMAFNRLVDWKYDALNPRTAKRHLPVGSISIAGAWTFTVFSALLFVFAASRLNSLCFALSPLALAIILFYSLTKRFTAWSHLFLGLGLGIAPVGAWLAITESFSAFPLWLGAGVLFWVGGFDTIYACQDLDFDRSVGLHSLAVRFGAVWALRIAGILHFISIICFWIAIIGVGILGLASGAGVLIMAILLVWEQILVKGGDLTRIDKAFFTLNSWIGFIIFIFVSIDVYMV